MGKHNKHTHQHDHLSGPKYLTLVLLNCLITVAEIVGGLMSGSLSLVSDAIHNLSDAISIMFSYFAWKIAGKGKDFKRTYGYKRAEIIAAFVNAAALIVISIFLIFESVKRFRNPEIINSKLMLGVAVFGLLANFVSMLVLKKEAHVNMNIKSSYLHLLSDTVSSVGVVLGGIAIGVWGIFWVDSLLTIFISVYILKESWEIIKKTVSILMQSSAELDYPSIKSEIENIPQVKNIHHVHTWMSNEHTIYFEAHIELNDCMVSETCVISEKISEILKGKYGIAHLTLQSETDKCGNKDFFKKVLD